MNIYFVFGNVACSDEPPEKIDLINSVPEEKGVGNGFFSPYRWWKNDFWHFHPTNEKFPKIERGRRKKNKKKRKTENMQYRTVFGFHEINASVKLVFPGQHNGWTYFTCCKTCHHLPVPEKLMLTQGPSQFPATSLMLTIIEKIWKQFRQVSYPHNLKEREREKERKLK